MLDEDGDGIYEVTLTLKPATYEFKYINGNTWDVGEASVTVNVVLVKMGIGRFKCKETWY